jgi:hypothetical protein
MVACASATEIMQDLYLSIHKEEGDEQGAKDFNFDDDNFRGPDSRNLWDE